METYTRSTVLPVICLFIASGFGIYPPQAVSQEAEESSMILEEVTVTARKREESIQEVPISVAAFTGDMIEDFGGTNITNVNGIAPNIILQTEGLVPNVPMFSIRGMNHSDPDPNSDPKTSMIIDGVYVPFVAATMLDMFDIDRVEVLRGPQGTLFGKNNLAGTINVTTSRPTGEFGGKVSGTWGSNGLQHYRFRIDTDAFANKTLSFKLAGSYRTYDGYARNLTTGNKLYGGESTSFRGALKWEPNDTFDATLIMDYTDEEVDGPGSWGTGVPEIQDNVFLSALNFDPYTQTKTTGVTIDSNWDAGNGVLTTVFGWRELEYLNHGDYDGTPYPGIIPQQNLDVLRDFDGDNWSIEMRFDSSIGDRFDYVAGIYYFQDDWKQVNDVRVFDVPDLATFGINQQEGKSYAIFAEGYIHFGDFWTLTFGGRYTKDDKKYSLQSQTIVGGVGGPSFHVLKDDDWSNFSPKIALEYLMNDNAMLYGSISTGYKGGGYNSRATLPALVGPYDEETVIAYEIGIKSDWMDNRLRFNAAAFFNEYDDLQVSVQRPGAIRAESITTNVAKAEISGIEFELTWLPIDTLQLGLNLGFMDPEYTDFCDDTDGASDYFPSDCGGFELEFAPGQWLIAEDQTHLDLANAPERSASILADWDIPLEAGTIRIHGDARYTNRYNTWGRSNDPLFYRDSVTLVNASISFMGASDRYRISIWGRNLTDEEVISGAVATGTNPITQFYQAPREGGVEFVWFF